MGASVKSDGGTELENARPESNRIADLNEKTPGPQSESGEVGEARQASCLHEGFGKDSDGVEGMFMMGGATAQVEGCQRQMFARIWPCFDFGHVGDMYCSHQNFLRKHLPGVVFDFHDMLSISFRGQTVRMTRVSIAAESIRTNVHVDFAKRSSQA